VGVPAVNAPGGAIPLRRFGAGTTAHAAGWGVTNVEYPLLVDARTVFQIRSTTKPVIGAILMRPADGGASRTLML
jgi:CubicO group peptidase (beta-lactamase class C family)